MRTSATGLSPTLASWFGAETPSLVDNVAEEHRAVREAAGVIDLSSRGKIRFTGPDRYKWLQGQVSNDVLKLESGKGQEACVCEVKGHILAFLRIYNPGDYLLADINPDICSAIIQRLDFYRILEQVEMHDVTAQLGLLGLFGPQAGALLHDKLEGWKPVEEYDCLERPTLVGAESPPRTCLFVHSLVTGEEGYEIYGPLQEIAALRIELLNRRAVAIGMETLNILRVENARPWQPFELNEGIFPQEAGIENRAVSFTKGCYLGQETIARIQSRGHVNRKLVSLSFEGEVLPKHNDELVATESDRKIGWVTSAVRSPARGLIGLGYVRREYVASGTQLMVVTDHEKVLARVT